MKNKKVLITIIAVIVIITVVTLIVVSVIKEKNTLQDSEVSRLVVNENIQKLSKDTDRYNLVVAQVKSYFNYLRMENNVAIYSLLDKEYIIENSIEQNNVLEIMNSDYSVFSIKEVYMRDNVTYPSYYLYINCLDKNDTTKKMDFYIKMRFDNTNTTYSILPLDKAEYDSEINAKVKKADTTTIDMNSYNVYVDGGAR